MLLSLCFRATLYTYTYVRPHVVGTKWGHFKLPSITKKQNVEEYYPRPSVHPKYSSSPNCHVIPNKHVYLPNFKKKS